MDADGREQPALNAIAPCRKRRWPAMAAVCGLAALALVLVGSCTLPAAAPPVSPPAAPVTESAARPTPAAPDVPPPIAGAAPEATPDPLPAGGSPTAAATPAAHTGTLPGPGLFPTAGAASPTGVAGPGSLQPTLITFRSGIPSGQPVPWPSWSGELMLSGFIYKPEGPGPFPAVLWNHGSDKLPGWIPELGPLFASKGYVFFIPHRRGQGRSPGDYIVDLLNDRRRAGGTEEWSKWLVRLHEIHLEDQLAALSYLKGLPYVDSRRIAVAGISFGGIQTVLAVEANARRDLGLRGAVNFAGAAQTWKNSSHLRDRLLTAVRQATVPVLFVQAENDYDLTPSRSLSAEMQRAGKTHGLLIFPPYGTTVQDGHAFGQRGAAIWGEKVFGFLDDSMALPRHNP